MTHRLTLVSHRRCPYVQRAAIVLAEKGIAFERIDVDLSNKPDWFLGVSEQSGTHGRRVPPRTSYNARATRNPMSESFFSGR